MKHLHGWCSTITACLADQHCLSKCTSSDLSDGSLFCAKIPFLSHRHNTCYVVSGSILEWNNHVSPQMKSGSNVRWVQGLIQDQSSDSTPANFIPFRTLKFYTPSWNKHTWHYGIKEEIWHVAITTKKKKKKKTNLLKCVTVSGWK